MSYDYSKYLAKFKAEYIDDLDGNGFLVKYRNSIFTEWAKWLDKNQPLSRTVYDALPDDKRRALGMTIWAGEFQSGRNASRTLREIKRKYTRLAEADAEVARKAAGWTGHNHLTDPEGFTNPPSIYGHGLRSSHRYGKLTAPKGYTAEGISKGAETNTNTLLYDIDQRIADGFEALSEQLDELNLGD